MQVLILRKVLLYGWELHPSLPLGMGGGKGMPGPMDFGQARFLLACLVFDLLAI